MKAILLAAGYGTRLRPLTNTIPKCLIPINGRPLLDIWLENLSLAGIEEFLVNGHYLPEKVASYINLSKYKEKVTFVYEPELLGTAGTLSANANFFDGKDGLVIHADNYCEADLLKLLDSHESRPQECDMTMLTFRTDDPSSCGVVELDKRGIVVGFHEKVSTPPTNLANGAVYAISHTLIDSIARNKMDGDFSCNVIPLLMGKIFTHVTSNFFLDIGTPENYKKVIERCAAH